MWSHRKTVTDPTLLAYCGGVEAFCDVYEIQNNNIEGSKEFYYPEHDHRTIMVMVPRLVLSCFNVTEAMELVDKPVLPAEMYNDPNMGNNCFSFGECYGFCEENFQMCEEYCEDHPENEICVEQFYFEQQ